MLGVKYTVSAWPPLDMARASVETIRVVARTSSKSKVAPMLMTCGKHVAAEIGP
eukprot:TRINITY_DN10915_c0_g1_i1.p2 TRINITY_DN10915_c0_g1~~TRINITY_DN10915_c0_g1_i1.p2  ORF type:complete len:54 (-),score=2.34 TRINITY_DN10915_c0_g1_i1:163-324(-)